MGWCNIGALQRHPAPGAQPGDAASGRRARLGHRLCPGARRTPQAGGDRPVDRGCRRRTPRRTERTAVEAHPVDPEDLGWIPRWPSSAPGRCSPADEVRGGRQHTPATASGMPRLVMRSHAGLSARRPGRHGRLSGMADDVMTRLLDRHSGSTFADEAGIALRDEPAPLFQLLVLTHLLMPATSPPTSGCAPPKPSRDSSGPQQRWSTPATTTASRCSTRRSSCASTRPPELLGRTAQQVIDEWDGDLRRLRGEADDDAGRVGELVADFPGIGVVGGGIFCPGGAGGVALAAPLRRRPGARHRGGARPAPARTRGLADALERRRPVGPGRRARPRRACRRRRRAAGIHQADGPDARDAAR